MAVTDMHIKIDTDVKNESEKILKKIGISMSDLINMTLRRVVYERRVPFDTQVPGDGLPENMQIETREQLESFLQKRFGEDDGARYSSAEVREMLGLRGRRVAA